MGFGKKSRKETKSAMVGSQQFAQDVLNQTRQQYLDYQNNFSKRNAPILELQNQASQWLGSYNRGVDVAKLNPALAQTLMNTANTTTKTMQVARNLGSNALVRGDKGFQDKLNSVAQRQIFRDMATLNEQGLMTERANQTGILMDTSNFLNQDRMAGLGLQGNLFNMSTSMFDMNRQRYMDEVARSNAKFGALMSGLTGGVQAFGSIMSGGAAAGFWGKKS